MSTIDAQSIRRYIEKSFRCDLSTVSDDDSLFTSGVVDSLSLLEILSFIERESGTAVPLDEVSIDDIDTLRSLAALGRTAPPLPREDVR